MDDDPDWIHGDPVELRFWRERQPEVLWPDLPAEVRIEAVAADDACPGGLLFVPPAPHGPDILHFHGGGFVVGSPETHRLVSAWIARLAGARVLSVRYRLAPEHPLPAQAEDAAAAIRRHLGATEKVRLAGDSAGALVALWGYAALAPEERTRIDGALLIYGAYGLPPAPGPQDAALEASGLGPRSIAAMWARVDPEGRMRGDLSLDPLVPGFPLPRLVLLAAGADPVLGDSRALASRAGAPLIVAEGQPHGFLSRLPAPSALGPLREALDALSA
jgi:acetyl esterase